MATVVFVSPVQAEIIAAEHPVSAILGPFITQATSWQSVLQGYATQLFWLLVLIQFTWNAVQLVIQQADVEEWLMNLVRQIFYIGLFYFLLTNAVPLANAIITSFRQAGSEASVAAGGTATFGVSDIFNIGVNLFTQAISNIDLLNPMQWSSALVTTFAAFILMICFACIAATMVVALVESYLVIYASVLMFGFGGSTWTNGYALTALRYSVSVGVKLFALTLIAGLGEGVFQDIQETFETNTVDAAQLGIIVGIAIIFVLVIKTIPDLIQGIINGTSLGQGQTLLHSASSVTSLGLSAPLAAGAAITGGLSLAPALTPVMAPVASALGLASGASAAQGMAGLTNVSSPAANTLSHMAMHQALAPKDKDFGSWRWSRNDTQSSASSQTKTNSSTVASDTDTNNSATTDRENRIYGEPPRPSAPV